MAEWKHKERWWINHYRYSDLEGEMLSFSYELGDPEERRFINWLDWQCEEGWEVFKISRDFNGSGGTWCIFRRLV